jgi:hypothetical protein
VPLPEAEAEAVLRREQFRHLGAEDRDAMRAQLRRVRFDAAVSMDADEALKAKKADATKVAKCTEWLRAFLAKYAFPSEEILAAAKSAGYTFDNLKEAKAELKRGGVISHSNSIFPGGWWSGPGIPASWTARPDPNGPTPHTPHSPHTPLSPLSPPSLKEEEVTGECGESGEWGGEGSNSPGVEEVL